MATFRSFSRFVSTPNIVGLENIPVGHSALLTPNHLSYFDPILLGGLLSSSGRETRALAKSELFEVPIIGAVLKAIKQIPVQRGTSSAANSLNMAKDALLSGALVAIYPEGTIPRDGRLGQFKTGDAHYWTPRCDLPADADEQPVSADAETSSWSSTRPYERINTWT